MRYLKRIIYFFIIFIFINQIIYAQGGIKKVLRVGFDYGSILLTESGSFDKNLGITFGYLTGFSIYDNPGEIIQLGIDINYKSTPFYRPNVIHTVFRNYKYQDLYDEKYQFNILELGLLPEFRYSIAENTWWGIYAGGSIGISMYDQTVNLVSSTKVDTTNYFWPYVEGPYDGISLPFTAVYGIEYGTSVYYKRLMIDFRFTISKDLIHLSSFHMNHYYVMLGYVL